MSATKLTSDGHVVLPGDVLAALPWRDGEVLDATLTGDGVLIRKSAGPARPPTHEQIERVSRILAYDGPRIPEEKWKEAIDESFRREWKK